MTLPEGLTYVPGFLTKAGERDVLAVLATVEHLRSSLPCVSSG